MKRWFPPAGIAIAAIVVCVLVAVLWHYKLDRAEQVRFERRETELVITNLARVPVRLYKAGKNPGDAQPVVPFNGERIWLPAGDYVLKASYRSREVFYPVPVAGYRRGPEANGSFAITIRTLTDEAPPSTSPIRDNWALVTSGNFLFGDRQNPREPHYVWLPTFFIARFEVTNAEFAEFLSDARGYAGDSSWTAAGRAWKAANLSKTSAALKPEDAEFKRFGQPDHPVTGVTWFEAQAYCGWLTKKFGRGRWLFSLPSEAEWEKAARGPDGFDFALSRSLSDGEVKLYNWKKNPGAEVTVVGAGESQASYQPNRYGIYHLSGNVVEWTNSVARPFNRDRPYVDAERNREDVYEARVARGGSWYSASIALLYIPYRDSFQPEVSNHDLGFRIVARPLP
jgi:formylglycine-generating enzyme required for sulfatase activity